MDEYEGWWIKYQYSSSQNGAGLDAQYHGSGYGNGRECGGTGGSGWGDGLEFGDDGFGGGHSDFVVEYREDL